MMAPRGAAGGSRGKGGGGGGFGSAANFPEQAANTILSIAGEVQKRNEVEKQEEVARKMKPDDKTVERAVMAWYRAAEKAQETAKHLRNSATNLGIYWKGDAFDAFDGFIQNASTTLEKDAETFKNVGNVLVDLYGTSLNGYNNALKLIDETLEKANKAESDSNVTALMNIFDQYCSDNQKYHRETETHLNNMQAPMLKVIGAMKQLQEPEIIPSGISDKGEWNPDVQS